MTTVNEMLIQLRLRIRGATHGPSFQDDTAFRLLTEAQRVINTVTHSVIEEAELTLEPYRQIYNVTDIVPAVTHVIEVRNGHQPLDYTPAWRDLAYFDRQWFRRVGDQVLTWSSIGQRLLILYPGLELGSSVTLRYIRNTTTIVDEQEDMELQDDHLPYVLDLVETLLLLRERRQASAKAASGRFTEAILREQGKHI